MILDAQAAPRDRMVDEQLAAKGIHDERVLEAFRRVPRHVFVDPGDEARAYDDHPLAIGHEQTISQPYIVARMTQALELSGGEKVLEVGTGSGYQSAILLALGADLYTIERRPELAALARENIERAVVGNAHYRTGDGTLGWPEAAPYDRIIVTAGAPSVPIPLVEHLREGGRMVIPVGAEKRQELLLLVREGGRIRKRKLCDCVFVKLLGREGW